MSGVNWIDVAFKVIEGIVLLVLVPSVSAFVSYSRKLITKYETLEQKVDALQLSSTVQNAKLDFHLASDKDNFDEIRGRLNTVQQDVNNLYSKGYPHGNN